MIDIHVIPNPGFDDNLHRIITSLAHPEITVHVSEWVEKNVLEARIRGYSHGTHPYVSWVDGDDRVMSVEWINEALEILESDPTVSAVYPRWQTISNGVVGKMTPIHVWTPELHKNFSGVPYAHHLTIMRRSAVMELLNEAKAALGCLVKSADRFLISGLIRYGRLVSIPTMAYEWNLRQGTGRTMPDGPVAVEWVRRRAAEDVSLTPSCRSTESNVQRHQSP